MKKSTGCKREHAPLKEVIKTADAKEPRKKRNNERKQEPGFSSIPLTPRKHKDITAKTNIELKEVKA
jgi:hypothetical protein